MIFTREKMKRYIHLQWKGVIPETVVLGWKGCVGPGAALDAVSDDVVIDELGRIGYCSGIFRAESRLVCEEMDDVVVELDIHLPEPEVYTIEMTSSIKT